MKLLVSSGIRSPHHAPNYLVSKGIAVKNYISLYLSKGKISKRKFLAFTLNLY